MKINMVSPNKELLQELLLKEQAPCISMYMPAHTSHPENLQDPILFKKLLKTIETSLSDQYSAAEIKQSLEPLEAVLEDKTFWNHTTPGIAFFSAPGVFEAVGFQQVVDELAVAADSFHTKPVRQYLQSTDRFQVLGLSLKSMQLFEGNRHALIEINLPGDVEGLTEGEDNSEKHFNDSTDEFETDNAEVHHVDSSKGQMENDTESYFRLVANEIYENFSKPSGLPLILAALPEHHSLFQKVNKNPFLLAEGIAKNPEAISIVDLATMAWEIMEPVHLQKIKTLGEQYEQAKANTKGSDDMKEVASAVAEGRVSVLLVEAGRIIPGKITDISMGTIEMGLIENPETDDLLDDITEMAATKGTDVYVIPAGDMPTQTGLAAIFRY